MAGAVRLDPGMEEFIRRSEALFPPGFLDAPLERQRAMYRALADAFATPRPPEITVTEGRIPRNEGEVPIRVYRPQGAGAQSCLVYFHGGGWIFGDLDSHDGITAELAHEAGVTILSVDYRLAPENPYPAAVEDGYSVLCRLAAEPDPYGIDPRRIGVGGDSAGGNLAAAMALRARDEDGPPLAAQVLIYPGLDPDVRASAEQEADGPCLSNEEIAYYARCYLGGVTRTDDPYAAPMRAKDFSALPPALVIAAEHDPLRGEAERYAERLTAAGVAAEYRLGAGLVHGFLRARRVSPAAGEAFADICGATRRLLT